MTTLKNDLMLRTLRGEKTERTPLDDASGGPIFA
jgi:hypothetical protein